MAVWYATHASVCWWRQFGNVGRLKTTDLSGFSTYLINCAIGCVAGAAGAATVWSNGSAWIYVAAFTGWMVGTTVAAQVMAPVLGSQAAIAIAAAIKGVDALDGSPLAQVDAEKLEVLQSRWKKAAAQSQQ